MTLQAGRLEQSCSDCGRWEAAGSYCSGCYRPMAPTDWYRNGATERRQRAPQNPRTPLKRPRGRPRKEAAA